VKKGGRGEKERRNRKRGRVIKRKRQEYKIKKC
jgi:hypothetical protein